jgi:hypothetical protein
MRAVIAVSILVLLGCGSELPTAPTAITRIPESAASESFDDGGAILTPQRVTLAVGEHTTATAAVRFPPAIAPWTILSEAPAIASAEGVIPTGGTSTVVRIDGKAPGTALLYYSVPNFGRAPSTHVIGEVLVIERAPKRRAVRH